MQTCIVTVGTSLWGNIKKNIEREGRGDDWLFHIRSLGVTVASAETNSLSRMLQNGILQADAELIFLTSATAIGERCAQTLANFFAQEGFVVSVRKVEDLVYEESRFKNRGMHNLAALMIELVRKQQRQGKTSLINATGGFKAEVAYATTVGLLFGIPVYYLHESFQDIIALPPAPISWDYSLLAYYEEFFAWMNGELRPRKETLRRLADMPEQVRMFVEEDEGVFMLSPAGEVFYGAYAAKLEMYEDVPVLFSAKAAEQYKGFSPSIKEKFDRIIRQIRVPEYRSQMAGQIGQRSDCRIFPRDNRSERIFFYDSGHSVHICELTQHCDTSYERALERGVNKEHYNGFSAYQP